MGTVDRQYLERRRRESAVRAEAATDPSVALVHREFAERYARALDDEPRETLHMPPPD